MLKARVDNNFLHFLNLSIFTSKASERLITNTSKVFLINISICAIYRLIKFPDILYRGSHKINDKVQMKDELHSGPEYLKKSRQKNS